jgi:hypothetical protein
LFFSIRHRERPHCAQAVRGFGRRCARYSFFLYDRSVTGVTDVSPFHLLHPLSTSIWRLEEDMAPKPDRLVFVFGMVVAMAVTILAITTWAAPPNPDSDSAAPISPRQVIYRSERWNLY